MLLDGQPVRRQILLFNSELMASYLPIGILHDLYCEKPSDILRLQSIGKPVQIDIKSTFLSSIKEVNFINWYLILILVVSLYPVFVCQLISCIIYSPARCSLYVALDRLRPAPERIAESASSDIQRFGCLCSCSRSVSGVLSPVSRSHILTVHLARFNLISSRN